MLLEVENRIIILKITQINLSQYIFEMSRVNLERGNINGHYTINEKYKKVL
jgi:hypothetical protein